MTDEMRILIAALGAYFLGAVYLAGLVAAGLVTGNSGMVTCALASAGIGYLVQVLSAFNRFPMLLAALWAGSVGAAVAGGILFLVG
jgi:hypothetical protein